jgi:5-oxoprolinase (ATP-hydrolysing)
LKSAGVINSLAVVLMHSYAFNEHEKTVQRIAKDLGFGQVSISSDVMQRIKIVSRG